MQERPGGSSGGPNTPRSDEEPSGRSRPSVPQSELTGLGLTMGLSIVLFALGGNWLDGRLGTQPLFVLLGVFLGFGGGFYYMYSRLVMGRGRADGDGDGE